MLGAQAKAKSKERRFGQIYPTIRRRLYGLLRQFICSVHAASALSQPAMPAATLAATGQPHGESDLITKGGPGIRRALIASRVRCNQAGLNLPLAATHCSLLIEARPWPLHAFAPGPGDLPPLQALWPLQAFTPMHWPSAACATVDMVMPARNRVAAAAAMAAPDLEVTFMTISSMFI